MGKIIFHAFRVILVLFFVFFLSCSSVSAEGGEFTINFNTAYNVGLDGTASVSQEISLANNLSQVYATSYSLILEGKEPKNIEVLQDGESLPFSVAQEEEQWKLEIIFPDAVIGKDKKRIFSINYTLTNLAMRNGQVWELSIPKLASPEAINSYTLQLRVPQEFGPPAYISPEPRQRTATSKLQIFTFQKQDLTQAGIVAGFGNFQVFSFNLAYHLKNSYSRTGETEIALPPDTALQRVYYTAIEPAPRKIALDEDGNWLATYRLGGGESLDVTTRGSVQIFTTPQEHYPKNITGRDPRYVASGKFWPLKEPVIQDAAASLRTPRDIYNFVVSTLSYDYSRVREGVERLGAKNALESPEAAICMEFTDTFIALARASGIPAREVNGFAYTENPEIQPLSLVADVLHAWPEYWDAQTGVWRPVDPTWGNTTGGVDFFDKFDLSHFVFAIHGTDVNNPPPAGSYKTGESPQKDVNVEFGALPENRNPNLQFATALPSLLLPLRDTTLEITIQNSGPVALYDLPLTWQTNNLVLKSAAAKVDFLPPFSETRIPVVLRLPLFSTQPQSLALSAADSSFLYNIPHGRVLALQVSTIFAALALLLGAGFLIFYLRVYAKISKLFARIAQRARSLHL